jgi:transposase
MAKRLWAGLDVGVETTSICIINEAGDVVHEAVCPTKVTAVHRELAILRRGRFARVCLEAGVGTALARGLRNLGYSVDIYETRKLSKFLRVRRNKTDAGDANGIAEAGRLGTTIVSKVHLKSAECQLLASRLCIRRHLVRTRVRTISLLCRRVPEFAARPSSSDLCAWQEDIDEDLYRLAYANELCRRLMQIPGVGPICALTFCAAVSEPNRFQDSTAVGCYLGLTPRLHQSGLTSRMGRISKMGNAAARSLLVQASVHFMRASPKDVELHAWASRIELRRGRGKARVALARKLAVVMLAIWKSGQDYQPKLLDAA